MNNRFKEAGLVLVGTLAVLAVIGLISFLTGRKANTVSDEGKQLIAGLASDSVADISAEIASKPGENERGEETTAQNDKPVENPEMEPSDSGEKDGQKDERKEERLAALKEELKQELDSGSVPELSGEERAEIRRFFGNTVFFGDSVTQAIGTYEMVDPATVIYKRGGTIDTITPLTEQVKAAYPGRVVIFTGLNDCNHYLENLGGFETDYRKMLASLEETVPAENIIVLSILPPSDSLGATRDDLRQAPVFDAKVREICASEKIEYVDIYWMIHQGYYLEDGIHFNAAFYRQLFRYLKVCLE